ncbi:ABC transporter ATP-binding protein [Kribbella pittospori]|uniref:ABC transporter ATP-binding protein n=1 Tax=Kribbella pittospori TaxID=722689 RepID=A0A4R0KWZ5_9ACTN|nr:ABC transporter ATP-binding protein [Kribbella pittospori]TCC65591.1 ABC transporter ATP-binding protein [Kribbella pittospori]
MTATDTVPAAKADGRTPLMTLDGVSQVFGTKAGPIRACDEVNLSINPGEVLCLVGESGSGKTTAARMAAGLAKPSDGTVAYNGTDIWSMNRSDFSTFRRGVQYVHQDPYASLNPTRTIQQTMTAPLLKHGVVKGAKAAAQRAAELLAKVDMTPPESYLSKYPHQLSGGQRQRISVARALTLDPKIIIADESTSMLDVSIRISVLAMLGRLRDELGVGFLFITHDLAIAKYFGWNGNTAVMYLGRIVEFGPTQQIINAPTHPYTRALIDAIPEPDPDLTKTKGSGSLRSLEIPSLAHLPVGCSFHPRCPKFEGGLCDGAVPELVAVRPGQSTACHVVARDGAGDAEVRDEPVA